VILKLKTKIQGHSEHAVHTLDYMKHMR